MTAIEDRWIEPEPPPHPLAVIAEAGPLPSWRPKSIGDLVGGIADGSIVRPAPTVGFVEGAAPLFYAGRVNGLFGRGGDAKSWIAFLIAALEMATGRVVWWIDFEDDELGAAERLHDIGSTPGDVDRLFRYVRPDEIIDLATRAWLHEAVRADGTSLVVVDSTGEWMGQEGVDSHKDEAVGRWFQQAARPLAAAGPAVALIDHLPHDSKGRLAPIGSQRKYAAINGASYLVEAKVEFGRGRIGKSHLTVAKDRLGTRPRGTVAAEFLLDATTDPYGARLAVPTVEDHTDGPLAGEKPAVRRVHAVLLAAASPLLVQEIGDALAVDGTTGTSLRPRTIQDALQRLRELGEVDLEGQAGAAYRWSMRTTPNQEPEDAF